jgi:hypothetical protein
VHPATAPRRGECDWSYGIPRWSGLLALDLTVGPTFAWFEREQLVLAGTTDPVPVPSHLGRADIDTFSPPGGEGSDGAVRFVRADGRASSVPVSCAP